MSDPIKPRGPRAPSPSPPIEREASVSRKGSFTVDRAALARAAQKIESEHLEGLRTALREGRVSADAAVDQLVQRFVDQAKLSGTEKADLERFLRAALSEDPALIDLTKDLRRDR